LDDRDARRSACQVANKPISIRFIETFHILPLQTVTKMVNWHDPEVINKCMAGFADSTLMLLGLYGCARSTTSKVEKWDAYSLAAREGGIIYTLFESKKLYSDASSHFSGHW